MNYTAKQISEIVDGQLIGHENVKIKNIAFDSRNIFSAKNVAFIALNTEHNSGEKYIASAIEKGVKLIISEKIKEPVPNISYIIVKNSLHALQQLATYHFQNHHLKTIGITGVS